MKKTDAAAIAGMAALLAVTVGATLYWNANEPARSPSDGESASSSSVSAVASSAWSLAYDPENDPEIEGTPAYEAAEQESLRNVERAKAVAEAFAFDGVPEEYEEYCPEGGGFCFSHPPSWGRATWREVRECIGRDDLIGLVGTFEDTANDEGHSYYFGAHAYSYAREGECENAGRGGSVLDWLPSEKSVSLADETIVAQSGATIALWYGYEVGWLTHDYEMAFAAPTGHPLVTRVAFIGPVSSDPDLTDEDIETFLTVAHSYRTVDRAE